MALDSDSHPTELVTPGVSARSQKLLVNSNNFQNLQQISDNVRVDDLKKAIPPHCFRASYSTASYYLLRDVVLAALLMRAAFLYIPLIQNTYVRVTTWALYGWAEGLVFTGLWVLAHECGHGSLFPSRHVNNVVGFTLHSALMVPYFSWQSTHRRHHIYANNMELDHNYVPPRRAEYLKAFWLKVKGIDDLTEDAPTVTLIRLFIQQIFGFPWYLANNITASPTSLTRTPSKLSLSNGHFNPYGALFRPREAYLVFASDLGLFAVTIALYIVGLRIGSTMTMLLYLQPYVWVNHWVVAITYLHHTHPDVPKYEPEDWTFVRGATATVDREFGFIGKYLFHSIIEFHVIHHLFSRIPFYHAEEATEAIIPLLGDKYHSDKQRRFLPGLWEAFTRCQWVEPDDKRDEKEPALWYRSGPSPPPQLWMGKIT
ncbi:MAG: hypothetical protein M1821_005718 [Bathelium mastoideum]|nr:MAG: hypothetical protein M1821_005718 [Bathelium mastoideum]